MDGKTPTSHCGFQGRAYLQRVANVGREEHFSRSQDCPFFTLVKESTGGPALKRAKSKKDRASKVSRLSTQSAFTAASEAPEDVPAEDEDSILTTATNATTKKMGKAKKAPATKGRKTRTKKGEPTEVEMMEPEDENTEDAPRPARGRKRKSEEARLEEVPAVDLLPPPAKRRATRTRGSTAVDDSILSVVEAPAGKPRGRKGRPSRKASTASVAPMRAAVPDDEEIDRALEADLERQVTEDEAESLAMPPPKKTRASKIIRGLSMFDAAPVEIDDAALDAELEAMEANSKPLPKAKGAKGKQPRKISAKQRAAEAKAAENAAEAEDDAERWAGEERSTASEDEKASQQLVAELEDSISMQHSPPVINDKKQRAPTRQATRKASGRATKRSMMSSTSSAEDVADDHVDESGNETEASMASQSTVIRGGSNRHGSTVKGGRGVKKALGRNIEDIVHKSQGPADNAEPEDDVPSARSKRIIHVEEFSVVEEIYYSPAPKHHVDESERVEDLPAPKQPKSKAAVGKGRPCKISAPEPEILPEAEDSVLEETPIYREATPTQATSPIHSSSQPPKELTPSPSPQSSDAENHPPSSRPSALAPRTSTPSTARPRIPLSDATPTMSPSKRNVIAGLQSNRPWSPADIDTIFMKSPCAEKPVTDVFGGAVQKIKDGELTSPEKKMTVEEWIKHNAAVAEEKLKSECERMVGLFEREGTRAMAALEGVECLE